MFWRQFRIPLKSERGVALVIVMLLLALASAILAGFLVTASGDTRLRSVDRQRTQAMYAAHAGLEKLTADLGDLFLGDFSPASNQITAIEAAQPTLTGVSFTATDGLGYDIAFNPNASGDPAATNGTISSGPFQGFIGLLTPYTLTVTSRTATGAESRLQRTMQTVSIPVFQFGVFSETDLTFSANGVFSFGGRVHTNGNLYLAAAAGGTLFLRDKVTAFGEVVRTHLANSRSISGTHDGTVMVNKSTANCPGTSSPYTACRPLAANEGSIQANFPSAANNPWWGNILTTYNGYLRNNDYGVTNLQLPLVSPEAGGVPIDLIRRGVPGEVALLTSQRLYAQASVRILLADTAAEITGLPGVSATAPRNLDTFLVAGVSIAAPIFLPPFAKAPATGANCVNGNCVPVNTPLIGGFLKVEYRNAAGVWIDATDQWLGYGYTRRNLDRATMRNTNTSCNEPNPNAIIRLQRIKQNPQAGVTDLLICNTIPFGGSTPANLPSPVVPVATDYWPLTLFDTREAFNRDGMPGASLDLNMAGVIHYVDLDVNNLRRWLNDTITGGGSGELAVNENGYAIYFSDRRGNLNGATNASTGEFGWEDIVNNGAAGNPNNTLNDGEDVNMNLTLQTYGNIPRSRTTLNALSTDFTGWQAPFNAAATPYTDMRNTNKGEAPNSATYNNPQYRARANPPLFFRRALKLTNGGLGNLPPAGLTIASENPVYVQGHYNAGPAAWGNGAPAAIMADSITLLSSTWDTVMQVNVEIDFPTNTLYWMGHGDTRSFYTPNDPSRREATDTWYRFGALAGKTRNWDQSWQAGSFGTDGGVHNFLRLTEDWNEAGRTLNYKGSIASFFYSRQNTGLFRCCSDVYQLPANRNLSFDTNFLDPALLPPKTPMFRDVNTTGFIQVTRRQ